MVVVASAEPQDVASNSVRGARCSAQVDTPNSPSSRVVELEGLLAGIDAKRNLWRSLRTAAAARPALAETALDDLIARATSQRDRLLVEHERAARNAFTPT